jgi:hypothetical protein
VNDWIGYSESGEVVRSTELWIVIALGSESGPASFRCELALQGLDKHRCARNPGVESEAKRNLTHPHRISATNGLVLLPSADFSRKHHPPDLWTNANQ